MNIRTLDLNLLRVFAAIDLERNVSAAARRENLSQPAVSNALTRLRRSFNDPLFVKTAGGMEPTALARQLIAPVREALALIASSLENQGGFDPLRSARTFKLLMSDAGESALLPALVRRMTEAAPLISIEVVRLSHERYAEALQSGVADLAIGNLPFLRAGFERRHLFDDPYCVVLRRGHALGRGRLDLETFAAAQHVSIATGNADALVDRHLAKHRKKRNVVLRVSHYHVAVDVAAGSDLLATVPRLIATAARGVSLLELPMKVESAKVQMVWHRTAHQDPPNVWLRALVAGLDVHTIIDEHSAPVAKAAVAKKPVAKMPVAKEAVAKEAVAKEPAKRKSAATGAPASQAGTRTRAR